MAREQHTSHVLTSNCRRFMLRGAFNKFQDCSSH